MNKKILVIIIVAAFAVSSVGGYLIYDSLYGNHDPSNTNKLAGGYMDISDAVSLSICTVQDSSETNVVSQSVSVDCGQGGNTSAVMLPTGGNISSSCETYKGFHNELHKATDKVADEKVKFYKNQSNLRSKLESDYSDWNIIYLEKCGSVYVMVYTIQDIDGLYDILMMDNCDFWNNDSGHMHFTMVDANTGKVFELTGLWCGSTAWRYEGTNDMISSLQYMGSYNGEEYFKVNVECNKYKAKPVDGTFYNIEGSRTPKRTRPIDHPLLSPVN